MLMEGRWLGGWEEGGGGEIPGEGIGMGKGRVEGIGVEGWYWGWLIRER